MIPFPSSGPASRTVGPVSPMQHWTALKHFPISRWLLWFSFSLFLSPCRRAAFFVASSNYPCRSRILLQQHLRYTQTCLCLFVCLSVSVCLFRRTPKSDKQSISVRPSVRQSIVPKMTTTASVWCSLFFPRCVMIVIVSYMATTNRRVGNNTNDNIKRRCSWLCYLALFDHVESISRCKGGDCR